MNYIVHKNSKIDKLCTERLRNSQKRDMLCTAEAHGMKLKRETYLEQIRPYYDSDIIKVITGVRRAGKSILLDTIKE